MQTLTLAKDLHLPVDIVTQTIALLAKRRAGKSYTMRRLVEQLYAAEQQVVLVDPKGDQWGLRFAADGKGPGLPFLILGGEHGDVPLEKSAGEIVAKLVVEERVSAILDLSAFRKSELAVFMTSFLETLYRLKAREAYRTAMMLVIDEADAVAPQKPQRGEERMLGAAEDIVRRGGQRGIGCVFVTQRSAVLNKNVLTQAQILIALRTIAPQDLDAMKAWIDVHGTVEQRNTLMASLPALPVGDAWVWSPGWPTAAGIFQRIHVLPIQTFDSGKSPEPGETRVEPKQAANVDLEALTRQMAATIEKAKADDPRELRKRIADLERQVKQAPAPKVIEKTLTVKPAITDAQIARVESLIVKVDAAIARAAESIAAPLATLRDQMSVLAQAVKSVRQPTLPLQTERQPVTYSLTSAPTGTRPRVPRTMQKSSAALLPARQKILNALAFLRGIGVAPADKTQLALFVGVSPTSGGYFNNLGALRSEGFITYPSGGTVDLTEQGEAVAVADGVPTSTAELHALLRQKLPPAKWKVLEAVIAAHPRAVSKDDIAAAIAVSPTSGGFFNNLGSLRSLGLIDYPQPGYVVARPVLFLGG